MKTVTYFLKIVFRALALYLISDALGLSSVKLWIKFREKGQSCLEVVKTWGNFGLSGWQLLISEYL